MPLILAVGVVLAFGFALLLSAVTVLLRDVAHFVGVFMQLWFWGTPVIYSLQLVADRPGLVRLLELNPVTGLVVSFRNVVVLDHAPAFRLLAYDAAFAVVVLAVGAWAFGRWQRLFSEIVPSIRRTAFADVPRRRSTSCVRTWKSRIRVISGSSHGISRASYFSAMSATIASTAAGLWA